jgi:hypothetical protein
MRSDIKDFDQKNLGRQFRVGIDPDDLKYYIKNFENGFGTYVKIQTDTIIQDNSLINIGNSYILCTLLVEEDNIISENTSDNKIESQSQKKHSNVLNLKIYNDNSNYDLR